MRPETLERIQTIIESNIVAGFVRGQDLFAESLNEDLQKHEILESVTVDGVMNYLLDDYQNQNS